MGKFKFKDKILRLKFRYGKPRSSRDPRRSTTAILEILTDDNPANNVVIATAKARCDSRDRFIKAVGRRKALTNALETILHHDETLFNAHRNGLITINHETLKAEIRDLRVAVWTHYFKTVSWRERLETLQNVS